MSEMKGVLGFKIILQKIIIKKTLSIRAKSWGLHGESLYFLPFCMFEMFLDKVIFNWIKGHVLQNVLHISYSFTGIATMSLNSYALSQLISFMKKWWVGNLSFFSLGPSEPQNRIFIYLLIYFYHRVTLNF